MLDTTYIFDGTLSSTGVPTGVAITTTRVSTNVLDMLVARDLGANAPLALHVDIPVALTGGTSLQIEFQCSSAAAGTYYGLLLSEVFPAAQLIAGSPLFRYVWPLNQLLNAATGILNAPGRYYRLNYTVVGTFSAGTVFSYISPREDRKQFYVYPANYSALVSTGEI